MTSRWRRPRTKVYDCNYNIGESLYKPAMDRLDRKYSGRPLDGVTPVEDRLLADREGTPSSRASRLMADLEANGVDTVFSSKPSRASMVADDDDAAIDAEFEATMKRIKAARAARHADLELELLDGAGGGASSGRKYTMGDQLLDSVGLNSKTQRAIEEDVIFKAKRNSARRAFDDEEDDKVMAKWTAVRPGARALHDAEEIAEEMSASARARASRARLQDIDNELEEMASKGAARQKRINDLRALVGESDAEDRSSIRVSKRVTVKSSAEKKQVSF